MNLAHKWLLAGLISTQLTLLFAESPFLGDSRPPRSIEIGKTAQITLQPDQPDAAEIVIAPKATKTTLFAAGGNMWFPKKRLCGTIPWTYQEGTFTTKAMLGKKHLHAAVSHERIRQGLVRQSGIG